MNDDAGAALSVALLPVNMLPREPRQHFQPTGREFTHGLATLVRTVSDHFEEMAKDANTSTNVGESPDTDGELE